MNSPVDPVLIQLVQQELKFLQDGAKNMSVEYEEERNKVQSELQNCASFLRELQQRVERLEIDQQNIECRSMLTEKRVDDVDGRVRAIEDKLSNREVTREGNGFLKQSLKVDKSTKKMSLGKVSTMFPV